MARVTEASLLKKAMKAVENDELVGFCKNCGKKACNVEPDARKYHC